MRDAHAGTLAELLKQYRARAHLSQEELAERSGLSARAISDLERGLKQRPHNATVRSLVKALGLSEQEQAVFEAVGSGAAASGAVESAAAPLAVAGHTPSHNLPLQLTPFIGREREVAEVGGMLLRPDVRLLTLTGPGGTGKTRLALRTAEELTEEFREGVRFVPLAAITEPELVISEIGQAVGVQETPSRGPIEGLEERLRDRQMLLVLDNFEQVLLAAPLIARLLVACPRIKALATSRVRLRVSGEYTYPVAPLTLPDPKHALSVEQVSECEAVQLFVARAREAKPGFMLTEGNAGAVAEICRRLDGLPLAIELAAARVRLLSPQAMLQRLGNKLALLTGGAQDLPARQQTLRATLDWSYSLLEGAERTLLARLAVFAGGCTLEAAESVCGGETDVLAGASSLVESSLLRAEERLDGEVHLRMSETVREYALARLAKSGEAETVRRRHADYYIEFAEEAACKLRGGPQARWVQRLEVEHDNLRVDLGWLRDRGQAEQALRLAVALSRFWIIRGHLEEGCRWLEAALVEQGGVEPVLRSQGLNSLASLMYQRADYERATRLHEEALVVGHTGFDEWSSQVLASKMGRTDLINSSESLWLTTSPAAGDRGHTGYNLLARESGASGGGARELRSCRGVVRGDPASIPSTRGCGEYGQDGG